MEAFLLSLAAVALAEFGDKTQLLVLVLAHRFRQPVAIAAGMILAFLTAHALAAVGGVWLYRLMPQDLLTWILGLGFIAMGAWAWLSRGHSPGEARRAESTRSAFLAAWVVFFLMEFGDKSQLATVGLAAALEPVWLVVLGATAGGTLINLPVLWLGHRMAPRVPVKLIRIGAALLFVAIGLWILASGALGYWSGNDGSA